jgi:hypothetical protein
MTRMGGMMDTATVTKEQIQEAILSLPRDERASLLKWLLETEKLMWDHEIEQDFSEGGAGAPLLDRIRKDFRDGRCPKWE